MSDRPPFKRDELIDEPGIVGARWWHEGLVHDDAVGRRATLKALLAGVAVVGVGALLLHAAGPTTPDTTRALKSALELQKMYGWNFGARSENLTFDGVSTQPFQPSMLSVLPAALTPARADLRPYFVPTLLQASTSSPTTFLADESVAFTPLSTVLKPIFTPAMDIAFRRGKALASLFSKKSPGVGVVVDLPGPESVAFAAGAAAVFEPVFAIDNWPHPRGVVPAHQTLAAAAYYQPLFSKLSSERPPSAPALFVLDRARLSPYTDDQKQFDNRHVARLPPSDKLRGLGIRRILYVAPTVSSVPELDDLNDDFVHDYRAGIEVKIVGADAFGPAPTSGAPSSSTPAPSSSQASTSGPAPWTHPSSPPAVPSSDQTDYYYASSPSATSSFWVDYPWLEPASSPNGQLSNLPPAGRDYSPRTRVTPFSGGSPTGTFAKTTPPNFAMVPVVVATATGVILGAEIARSGSWSRSSGGWGGGGWGG